MDPYTDVTYYKDVYKGTMLPEEDVEGCLMEASRHIAVLTFNRIKDVAKLTDLQRDTVAHCCCKIAEFEYENEDIIKTPLQSYGINGVSMSFGSSWNVEIRNGIAVPKDVYNMLKATGLCCLSLR